MKNPVRRIHFTLSILAFLLAAPAIGQAVRTFVSSNGIDNSSCSLAAPCRNFEAAITAVAPGGEVVALDSAGYGPVTINKSVSIIAAPGIHAAIAPQSGNAITVSASTFDRVILRGLYLNSRGAVEGVAFLSGNILHIERCVINGFSDSGVLSRSGHLIVSDTVFSENDLGVQIIPFITTTVLYASVSGARFENSGSTGLMVVNGRATCLDCDASGGAVGFRATPLAGERAELTLERCVAAGNSQRGVLVDVTGAGGGGTAIVRVSDSQIVNNLQGIEAFITVVCSLCAEVLSRGNNTLEGNVTDGTFTGTLPAK